MQKKAEVREDRGPYELRGGAARLMLCDNYWDQSGSAPREVVLVGPAGCVAPGTRIYDPHTGYSPTIESLHRDGIAPTVLTMSGPRRAEIPFIKGTADLFEVRMDSGRRFTATADHRVLTPDGWRCVYDIAPGRQLLGCDTTDVRAPLLMAAQSHWDVVESVRRLHVGEYFDIHVPGEEHYLAEGVFHHNTGKSIACLLRLHMYCDRNPNVRALMLRKTRSSLTESAMVSFEEKVLPPRHPALKSGGIRRIRQSYRYPNGSEIIVGGMDNAAKIMSTEYDLVYVNESTDLEAEDWESLITRLRNNKLHFQQIYGDANPQAPTHWLKRRCDAGRCLLLESKFEDNPAYYDLANNRFTEAGTKYLSNLDSLTGARLLRLRYGQWAQAEGVIYPEFDPKKHVIMPAQLPGGGPYPPPDWARYWGVDFGIVDPFVCLMMAVDHEGRMYVYREIYHTGMLVEDHAKRIKELWLEEAEYWGRNRKMPMDMAMKWVAPRAIICDHQAEDRATLERHLGLSTTGARKYIKKGIQMVSERLRPSIDGEPRIKFLANMLDRKDLELDNRKQPCSLLEEVNCYTWNPERDMPIDKYNHACFAAGTAVQTSSGSVPIERVAVGDMVLTRRGYRPVLASSLTARDATVVRVTFSNGDSVVVTPDHPFWSRGAGAFVPVGGMGIGDGVLPIGGDARLAGMEACGTADVYNLTVGECHEYYAAGVLVSNCDVLRYLCNSIDAGMSGLWEAAEMIVPGGGAGGGAQQNSALNPNPRIRWGSDGRDARRGHRLFGLGG